MWYTDTRAGQTLIHTKIVEACNRHPTNTYLFNSTKVQNSCVLAIRNTQKSHILAEVFETVHGMCNAKCIHVFRARAARNTVSTV